MFLKGIREKMLQSERVINSVYLIVFAIYFTYIFIGTTMISDKMLILPYRICTVIAMLIAVYRFFTLRKAEWQEAIFMLAILLVTGGYFAVRHLKLYFIWGIMLIGAKNVSFRKIIQIAVCIGTVIMFLALVLSQAGMIEDIIVNSRGADQHSLGINYSTDCAAHVLYLMMGYFCIRNAEIKKFEYAIGLILICVVFFATRARNNFICMLIFILSAALYQFIIKKYENKKMKRLLTGMVIFFCVICCSSMIYMTAKYNWDDTPFLNKLDGYLSGRLSMGKYAFDNYGIKLFGSDIPQAGSGRGGSDFYFFLDSSYVLVLLERGILMLALMCAITLKNIIKSEKNDCIYIAGIIAVTALQCMVEHHWMDISYNIFLFITFADFDFVQLI